MQTGRKQLTPQDEAVTRAGGCDAQQKGNSTACAGSVSSFGKLEPCSAEKIDLDRQFVFDLNDLVIEKLYRLICASLNLGRAYSFILLLVAKISGGEASQGEDESQPGETEDHASAGASPGRFRFSLGTFQSSR